MSEVYPPPGTDYLHGESEGGVAQPSACSAPTRTGHRDRTSRGNFCLLGRRKLGHSRRGRRTCIPGIRGFCLSTAATIP